MSEWALSFSLSLSSYSVHIRNLFARNARLSQTGRRALLVLYTTGCPKTQSAASVARAERVKGERGRENSRVPARVNSRESPRPEATIAFDDRR